MSVSYDEKPWIKHYDEGVPDTVDIPDHSLQYFLDEAARKYPEQIAIILRGYKISYRELNELTDAVAAEWQLMDSRKGTGLSFIWLTRRSL